MRKALIGSFLLHVALAIGVSQWAMFQRVNDPPRQVYEVELVDAVQTSNSRAAANVEPAVFRPAPPDVETAEERPEQTPAPEKKQPKPDETTHDIAATWDARRADTEPDSNVVAAHTGRLRVAAGAKASRFAIDAPPGEATSDPIGDLEARGSVSQPLHVTRAGSYSEAYIILHAVKPKYPEHERERSIEGSVTVELLVDEHGFVANANVIELVGPVSFQNSALDAVRQFEFQPPIENGEATTMWIKFVIKFRINS